MIGLCQQAQMQSELRVSGIQHLSDIIKNPGFLGLCSVGFFHPKAGSPVVYHSRVSCENSTLTSQAFPELLTSQTFPEPGVEWLLLRPMGPIRSGWIQTPIRNLGGAGRDGSYL